MEGFCFSQRVDTDIQGSHGIFENQINYGQGYFLPHKISRCTQRVVKSPHILREDILDYMEIRRDCKLFVASVK